MNKFIALASFGCLFSLGLNARGFLPNGSNLYYNKGNVGIGTVNAPQRLTIEGGNIEVTGALAALNEPSQTYINLINKGVRGGVHQWKIITSSSGGAWGVGPNCYEVWEYPELSSSTATEGLYLRRFVIQTNRAVLLL